MGSARNSYQVVCNRLLLKVVTGFLCSRRLNTNYIICGGGGCGGTFGALLKIKRDFLGAGFPRPRGEGFRAGSFWTGAPERTLGLPRALWFCTLRKRGRGEGGREGGREGGSKQGGKEGDSKQGGRREGARRQAGRQGRGRRNKGKEGAEGKGREKGGGENCNSNVASATILLLCPY